jgi:hypothetical protein
MEYRTLGASGCTVSALALGTMTFGAESDETESHRQLDVFLEAGGTLIDTADVYSNGVSEEIIGRWLARKQPGAVREVVLATKGRFPTGPGPNAVGLSRRHLAAALDASLGRLGAFGPNCAWLRDAKDQGCRTWTSRVRRVISAIASRQPRGSSSAGTSISSRIASCISAMMSALVRT